MRVDDSNLAVGLRVQRSADWHYDNQDGGAGKGGSILSWMTLGGVVGGAGQVKEGDQVTNMKKSRVRKIGARDSSHRIHGFTPLLR